MYSAETTIVDVKQTGEEQYTLSMTAKDLYVAAQSGDVIRRHDVSASDKAPEKKYVALSGVKFAEATGKYTFTFESGDVMEASSADAYPTASSISDSTDELPAVTDVDEGKVLTVNNSGVWVAQNPSSGGGVLVVTYTEGTLDKTWQEIHDAMLSGGAVINHTNTELGSFDEVAIITDAFHDAENGYGISVSVQGSGKIAPVFYSQTADGYPVVG